MWVKKDTPLTRIHWANGMHEYCLLKILLFNPKCPLFLKQNISFDKKIIFDKKIAQKPLYTLMDRFRVKKTSC